MIFRVTLKPAPDTLESAIKAAVKTLPQDDLNDEELDFARDRAAEITVEICKRWFKDGGCLTVEIDTYEETCIVLEDVQ